MHPRALAILALALALAGCGGEDEAEQQPAEEPATTMSESADSEAVALARRPRGAEGLRVPAQRARIVVKDSEFGRVLFDANGQVVYVFEIDRKNRSNCTSAECVKAWPPLLTRERPSAGAG